MTELQLSELQSTPLHEEIAAALALMLAGGVVSPGPIAALLLLVIPGHKPSQRREVATRAAAMILEAPGLGKPSGVTQRAVQEDVALHRSWYAVNATRRMMDQAALGEGFSLDALAREERKERRYFHAHRLKSEKHLAVARVVDAAADAYGDTLGWYSVIRPTSRPHHARAHAQNFRAGTVPRQTGALPGVEPHCLCTVGPPIPGGTSLD